MISEPIKRVPITEILADSKALYLNLCAHHVDNADIMPDLAEARDMAEKVVIKIGSIVRSKVNGARLEGEA